MRVRTEWLMVVLMLAGACTALVRPGGDGGTESGDGGAGTGGGAGGGLGGGTGGSTDAGRGPPVEASMTISQQGSSRIVALSGTVGDVWALEQGGWLFRSTSGPFERVVQLGGLATGLVVSGGGVFTINADNIRSCLGSCTTAAAFSTFNLDQFEQGWALCGRAPDDLWAVAETSSSKTSLYHRAGGTWVNVASALPLASPRGCSVDGAGVVYVSGADGVLRYDHGGAAFEAIGAAGTVFTAVFASGTEVQAVGDKYRVGRRGAGGAWTVLDGPVAGDGLFALHGSGPEFMVKAGGSHTSVRSNWATWDGTRWREADQNLRGLEMVYAALAVSPREVYFGGWNNVGGEAIVRVTW